MYLATLVSPISMPSLSSSPWIRGAPHNGFSRLMHRIKCRISRDTVALPAFPRRPFHVQNNRNPLRCQAITVSGLTMTSADRQSLHTRESQAHSIRSTGDSLGPFVPNGAARQADDGGPGSQSGERLGIGRRRKAWPGALKSDWTWDEGIIAKPW